MIFKLRIAAAFVFGIGAVITFAVLANRNNPQIFIGSDQTGNVLAENTVVSITPSTSDLPELTKTPEPTRIPGTTATLTPTPTVSATPSPTLVQGKTLNGKNYSYTLIYPNDWAVKSQNSEVNNLETVIIKPTNNNITFNM